FLSQRDDLLQLTDFLKPARQRVAGDEVLRIELQNLSQLRNLALDPIFAAQSQRQVEMRLHEIRLQLQSLLISGNRLVYVTLDQGHAQGVVRIGVGRRK